MIGLLSAVLPSVMEVAGRFLPEDKEKRAAAEREIEAQLTDAPGEDRPRPARYKQDRGGAP